MIGCTETVPQEGRQPAGTPFFVEMIPWQRRGAGWPPVALHHRRSAAPRRPRTRGGGGGLAMPEGYVNSRKPASEETDYWSYARASRQLKKLIDAEAEIARELGSNESLRQRLSDCVRTYIDDVQRTGKMSRLTQSEVRRRLKQIKTAAAKLRNLFTENPKAATAKAELKSLEDQGYGFAATNSGWKEALGNDELRALQETFATMYESLKRKSIHVDGVDVLVDGPNVQGNFDINVTKLCEMLDALCAFIDRQQKKIGGRPTSEAWNSLMLSLAGIYEDATRKEATITENEHRAGVGQRYSGGFIRVATWLDKATADYRKVEARQNSALGPALRRLLKARQNRRTKTR